MASLLIHVSSSCTAFSQNTASDMKMQQHRMSEVPLKHFQRHFHKYILQMYRTPQSSLTPTHGITESYCWWCYIVTKAHFFFSFFLFVFFYNWLHRCNICISGYLFYIICSKFKVISTQKHKKNITKWL